MKVVSLLPSATEIVFALGMGDALAAVTDECDWPPEVDDKPVVSRSALPPGLATSREIDDAVRTRMDAKEPLYRLDVDLIRRIEPDVILTQDLCRVCAVPSGQVERALQEIGASQAQVLSLDPHSLDQVVDSVLATARLLGVAERGEELVATLGDRLAAVGHVAERLPSVRAFALEWLAPPFVGGHWVPDMVRVAGGQNLLNEPELPSRVVTWDEIERAAPEVVVFMPCGYDLDAAQDEGEELLGHPRTSELPATRTGNVFAVDATSYFSRPGPRVVDGVEALAWALHPDAFPEPPAGRIVRLGLK
ncbi:MAG: cobalamin-binding protein [Actinomycetota bacterium]